MVAVKKSKKQSPPVLRTFRILYKGGQEDYVNAHSFIYQPRQGDIIKFYDADNNEASDLLLRAPEVASVIADTRMASAPPLLALQGQMKSLEVRIDALEKNLVDIVAQALDVVITKRGLQLSPE